jgi:hypothetical protein
MAYRVFWTPNAEQKLSNILGRSRDASIVAAAAREFDSRLITAPTKVGESRIETLRIGFERPLGFDFDVLEDVKTVIVLNVWRTDRRW